MATQPPPIPGALQALTAQAQYGPMAGQAIQRSQYLADVLRQMQSGETQPRSAASLGVNLLAQAITQYSKNKADRLAMDAFSKDRANLTDSALSGLPTDEPTPPAAPMQAPPSLAPPAASAPAPAPPPLAPQAPSAPMPPTVDPAAMARGLRNNNPLNITNLGGGQQWNGQSGSDGMYAKFTTPQDGWNAADKNLTAYNLKHGINNVDGVVKRWAPDAPPSYAQRVAAALKVDPNAPLDLSNPDLRHTMLSSMAGFENGQPVQFGQGAGQAPPQAPQMAPRVPIPAQPIPAPAPGGVPAGGAAPPSPPVGAAPASLPHDIVTPQEVALAKQWMSDPRTFEQGLAYAQKLKAKQASLPDPSKPYWGPDGQAHFAPGTDMDAHFDPSTGQTYYTPKNPNGSAPTTMGAPGGFKAPLTGNLQYGADGKAQPIPGTASTVSGSFQPNTVVSTGPDGKPTVVQAPPYDANALLSQRDKFKGSDTYKQAVSTAAALNSLQDMMAKATGNNGVIDIATFDALIRAASGLSARQGSMQMAMEHLGFPSQALGFLRNMQGDGFITPEQLQNALGSLRSYATTHQSLAQHELDQEAALAKGYGFDFGLTLPALNPTPDVPWMHKGLGAVPDPGAHAAAPIDPQVQATHDKLRELYKAGQLTPQQVERARKLGVIK